VCRDLLVWVVILVIYIHFFPPSSILLDVISFFGEKLFEIFEAYDGAVPWISLAETNWFFIVLSFCVWRWWRFLVRSWLYLSCLCRHVCVPLDGASRHLHCRLMVSLYFAVWTESSTGPQKLLNVLIQWNKTKKKLWRSWKAQQFLSWRMEKSTHIV
jgi:hypothetical protein